MKAKRALVREREREKINKVPTAARIVCEMSGMDGQSTGRVTTSMGRFMNVLDLVLIITEESACIQF